MLQHLQGVQGAVRAPLRKLLTFSLCDLALLSPAKGGPVKLFCTAVSVINVAKFNTQKYSWDVDRNSGLQFFSDAHQAVRVKIRTSRHFKTRHFCNTSNVFHADILYIYLFSKAYSGVVVIHHSQHLDHATISTVCVLFVQHRKRFSRKVRKNKNKNRGSHSWL